MNSFSSSTILLGLFFATTRDVGASYFDPSIAIVPSAPCKKISETCEPCRCGQAKCTIVEECRHCLNKDIRAQTSPEVKDLLKSCENPIQRSLSVKKPCCKAECENGGTTLVPSEIKFTNVRQRRGVGHSYRVKFPFCRLFFRFPRCMCPPGFEGRCCEKLTDNSKPTASCATTRCPTGTRCHEERPCELCNVKVTCVKSDSCPLRCPPGTTCTLAPPRCPGGAICPTSSQLVYQCMPIDPCERKKCPAGTICKKSNVVCEKASCKPVVAVCHPTGLNPCSAVRCPSGTVCKLQKGRPVCESPLCPPGPSPGIVTTCDVRCSSNEDCHGSQICCSYGCSRRCTNPSFGADQSPSSQPKPAA